MSNGRRSCSVKCFAKALSNRCCLILTLYELSTTSDRIVIDESVNPCTHCMANTLEVLVISVKIPLLLLLSTLKSVHFCFSCKWFGNCWLCKALNENLKLKVQLFFLSFTLWILEIFNFRITNQNKTSGCVLNFL